VFLKCFCGLPLPHFSFVDDQIDILQILSPIVSISISSSATCYIS
jgi:hypothetical protein